MAFQDFSTYTEIDPNGRLAVTTNVITVTSLSRDENGCHVYKNFGVNFFRHSFTHEGQLKTSTTGTTNGGYFSFLNFQNSVTNIDNTIDHVRAEVFMTSSTTPQISIVEAVSSTLYTSGYIAALDVDYWWTFDFDITIGTYGTIYLYIYTDASRTTLVSTLSVALHKAHILPYGYVINSFDDNQAALTISGEVSDYVLGAVGSLVNSGLVNNGLIGGRLCG